MLCHFLHFFQPFLFVLLAQDQEDSIGERETSEILNFLSSDSLKGRGNFTPELIQAGNFIISKFKEYGLQPFPGSLNFYQPFNAGSAKNVDRDDVLWNGKSLAPSQFFYLTSEMIPETKVLSAFHIVEYNGIFNDSIFLAHWLDTTNTLIWMRHPQLKNWQISIDKFRDPGFPPAKNILFVADPGSPYSLVITMNKEYEKNVLFNMIGVLPGKTKPNEIIIFSAHYDHLGSIRSSGDWHLLNGANR